MARFAASLSAQPAVHPIRRDSLLHERPRKQACLCTPSCKWACAGARGPHLKIVWRTCGVAVSPRQPRPGGSELISDSLDGERLHHCLGRLRLDHDFFAEHKLLAGFGGCLLAGLDHDEAWKGELASLLHLRAGWLRLFLSKKL